MVSLSLIHIQMCIRDRSTSWSRVSLTVRIAAFLIIFVLLYDWCCYSLLMFVLPCFSVLLLSLCFLTCPYIVFLKKYQFLVGISLCCIANECMMCTEMHCKSQHSFSDLTPLLLIYKGAALKASSHVHFSLFSSLCTSYSESAAVQCHLVTLCSTKLSIGHQLRFEKCR